MCPQEWALRKQQNLQGNEGSLQHVTGKSHILLDLIRQHARFKRL